jgi:transposase-like protein
MTTKGAIHMPGTRKRYSAEFKAKVALSALQGQKTINELAAVHSVHPNQIVLWMKQATSSLSEVFADKRVKHDRDQQELISELYRQIGQLKVELDWLKKKSGLAD